MGDVVHFPGTGEVVELFHGDASPPRSEFGLRARHADAAMELARDADVRQQARVKQQARIERAARGALDAMNGRHVDKSMKLGFAARLEHFAQVARMLAEEAHLVAERRSAELLLAFAHEAETDSATIEGGTL